MTTTTKRPRGGLYLIALAAILFLGAILFAQGSQACGNVPAGISQDSAETLVARGDTIAAADPRIGTSAVRYACVTDRAHANEGGTVLRIIAGLLALAGLIWFFWPRGESEEARLARTRAELLDRSDRRP
jgi:hypothetical protein